MGLGKGELGFMKYPDVLKELQDGKKAKLSDWPSDMYLIKGESMDKPSIMLGTACLQFRPMNGENMRDDWQLI